MVQSSSHPGGSTSTYAYLKGTGQGPQQPEIAFAPGLQTAVGASFGNAQGVAVDSGGNVWVADEGVYNSAYNYWEAPASVTGAP